MKPAAPRTPWIGPKLLAKLAADSPSSVHPPELKSELPSAQPGGISGETDALAETFRHSGWRRRRQLIYAALYRTGQSRTRTGAFASCGSTAFVYRSPDPPYKYRLAGSSCHDKLCLPCAKDRSRCIATNVLNEIRGQPARFMSLTLKHSSDPLTDQLTRLQRCFARLRGTKAWKTHVSGGAAFIEIKWIPADDAWHPHFHVICQGRYFPQRELKAAWWRITGDSYIVDIRPIENDRKIAAYVTKYAAKAVNDSFIGRPDQLDQAVVALKGRRLCHTFGTWRGVALTETPGDSNWVAIGSFHDVALRAIDADRDSLAAMAAICGDRMCDILARVKHARPPPTEEKPIDRQLTFAWPPIDNTF